MIIILILLAVFWFGRGWRNFRRTAADMGLTMVTIVLAVMWVWGFWKIIYDEPNPMTQIIPILLIGLGVDYSIHLMNHHFLVAGREGIEQTLARLRPSIVLGGGE